ncbi:hypothetical protein E6O75_ATG08184 [Venturia nashicola]|uniref:Uncharacterized protein n=1 Tax=Venturia nashicola TaxID=86259 RepID=A0A4Z1NVI0_9PEZI|nr:hypothetical protein E6O75_ATG08184 [Venturia nashicola]
MSQALVPQTAPRVSGLALQTANSSFGTVSLHASTYTGKAYLRLPTGQQGRTLIILDMISIVQQSGLMLYG